jgi:transcriptional regulator with XRE-family HTH domain
LYGVAKLLLLTLPQCCYSVIDPWRIEIYDARVDPIDLRTRISLWRESAGLTQGELDRACKFKRGTVARLEQHRLKLTEEQLVRILISTGRDVLWSLAETFGALYRSLEPLERDQRASLGKPAALEDLPADDEFQNSLQKMLSEAQVVLSKMARASDQRRWFADILLRAAGTDPAQRKRKRVRKARRSTE